jgi:glycosyltransferase involved in cell wall biosynthesis
MPPTILVVIGDLDLGGTEIHLLRVLPALARNGLTPLVYTLTHRASLAPRLREAGVEVILPPAVAGLRSLPRSITDTLHLPLATGKLWRLIRQRRPDIVHLFLPAAYLVGGTCALLAGHRAVVMSRRSLNRYQRKHPVLGWLERRLHRRITAALGNSRAVMAELAREGVPPERLGLIYNGIEPATFANLPSSTEARARLNIDPSAVVLTTLANLIPYKGHGDLLVALAAVADRLPANWVLLCAGRDDGAGPTLRAQARDLGLANHVRWLGLRLDVAEVLAASDLGILVSHQEGFSNSVLESMASGLAVIVSDVGGNAEAIEDHVSGVVVPPQDPATLGAAILQLVHNPAGRQRMGAAARARVAGTFDLEVCVARYRRLYTLLATGEARAVGEALAPTAP